MSIEFETSWRRRLDTKPFCGAVSFVDGALTLGAGTRLLRLDAEDLTSSPIDDRLVALLAVATGGKLSPDALIHITAALADWRRGDKALAAIRLAFAPLPRLDLSESYPLFLAEEALDAGMSPRELVTELGYDAAIGSLMKAHFNPNEPRVPKGRTDGGQWDKGDARVTPVFYRNPEAEEESEDLEGHPPPLLDEEDHKHVPRITPFVLGGGGSANKPVSVRPPILVPAPDISGGATTRHYASDDTDKDGLKCLPDNDVGHGASAAAEQYEYDMSRRLNPDDPTFKRQPGDPALPKSMAYFLYSQIRSRPVSYDDCKKTNAPNSLIPDIREGDMVEYKNAGFFIPFAPGAKGYKFFEDQMGRQNDGVRLDGRGRHVFYCFGNSAAADTARTNFGNKFPESRFVFCPPNKSRF